MSFKPPIPTAELHSIGVRQDARDITRLLWEIKRLRGMVLRSNQVIRTLPDTGGPGGIVLECLRKELKTEPCILDEEQRRLDTM